MLAGPTVPLAVMCRAVARTHNMLVIAATIDLDRSDDDRAFFAAEAKKLEAVRDGLIGKRRALEDFDLGPGDRNQAAVLLGDGILDYGVRTGNQRAKLGLRGKSGLGADHAFGSRVDDLTGAPLKTQPGLVRDAIARLDDLPDFDDKAKVKADLMGRVELQEGLLKTRDEGDAFRTKLESEAVKLIVEAADRLAQTKSALDGRFPRQRAYVATFFLDVSRKRRRGAEEDGGDDAGGSEGAPQG